MPLRTAENTYLVEHYRPGLTAEELGTCVHGIRAALRGLAGAGEGAVRFLGSVAVPADEAFLLLLGAASDQVVQKAYDLIGATYDRISVALAELDPLPAPRPHGPTTRKGTTP
jgi:hypothetical protein